MYRYWFFTWRTYGTWLPGEDGFVGYYRNPHRIIDNLPGSPHSKAIPPLQHYAEKSMTGRPRLLTMDQARILGTQFLQTALFRGWPMEAMAILPNHIHLVFGVPNDPDPSLLLKTWKVYASRALNHHCQKKSNRWFADGGSKRLLRDKENRISAIIYVKEQIGSLLIWLSPEAIALTNESGTEAKKPPLL